MTRSLFAWGGWRRRGAARSATAVLLVGLLAGSGPAQQNLRAWFANGQTFLRWEHSTSPHPVYAVYAAGQPIRSLRNATLVEMVFATEGENARLADFLPGARWRLPDTFGGTVRVDTNEAYAVLTPLGAESLYVAVVRVGDTVVGGANTTGPVLTRVEPVLPVVQYQDTAVTIYGHWVDGRADFQGGRPDYPPMADQFGNGCGHNFAVWEPAGGRPPGNLPLVMVLHGGGQNLLSARPSVFPYTRISNGLVASFDDGLCQRDTGPGVTFNNSFWLGYWCGFNRFAPAYPPDTAVVVDYTARRLRWELEYLLGVLPIDSSRIAMMGASMGGVGTLFHTQSAPARFSAATAFVPPLAGPVRGETPQIGTRSQNLRTNLPGSPGIWDVLTLTWRLSRPHPEWPPTVMVCGRGDTVVGWSDKPGAYRQRDSARTGFQLYWDEREHTGWTGSHFYPSGRSHAAYLTRFRVDRSFPAFAETDLDTLPGRQPDPGDGTPPSGDTWGTWGGYLDWDTMSLRDTTDGWEVRVRVVTNSPIPCDNSPSPRIAASVTPRRLQTFRPVPGQPYRWLLTDTFGQVLREDTVYADSQGAVTTPQLVFRVVPLMVRIEVLGSAVGRRAGTDLREAGFRVVPSPFVRFAAVPGRTRELLDVYDAGGRRVASGRGVRLGEGLTPGVYFVRPDAPGAAAQVVVKVR